MSSMNTSQRGGCLLRINALYDSLKAAELRLADYILNNQEKVIHFTISSLQEKSGSSYATIIRFCKKAGYSGYKEFKKSLEQDVLNSETSSDTSAGISIDLDDSTETIIQKAFQHSIKTLEETQGILDVATLETAADKMVAANEVYFIGTGSSGVSAQYAYARFFRIGFNCSAQTDPAYYKTKTSILKKSDVLFAISSSGRSHNVVDAARLAYKSGVTVISLCDFAVSPLTRTATINLYTTPRNTTFFLDFDMPFIIGQINIIDILFTCCCSRMGEKAIMTYNNTKRVADREKIFK